jgi:hypothetical protein
MLGLATDENTQSRGIGVVGRSVGGEATEAQPVEDVMASPIGILGQSALGTGMRGHGGPLLPIPFAATLLVTTNPKMPVQIDLSLGATGSPTSANIISPPAHGLLTKAGGTLVDFQLDPSLTAGKETKFGYTLANAKGTSEQATVIILITATMPAPAPVVLPTSEEIEISPIGGVSSLGQLASQQIPLSGGSGKATGVVLQQVSRNAFAQLQLVPFASFSEKNPPKLPTTGEIGALFLCVIATHQPTGDTPLRTAAQLWICTGYVQDKATGNALPQWQPVQLGLSSFTGGTPIPLTAAPWA